MLSNVTPFTLKTFLSVCDTGSFSEAAEKIGITQSAVSQTISRLENKINLKLFDKSQRPYVLTQAGLTLLTVVPSFLEQIEIANHSLLRLRDGKPSHVRFGMSEVASKVCGKDLEAALISRLSSLDVKSGLIPFIQSEFEEGRLDLALVPELDVSQGIIGYQLTEEDYYVVTPSALTNNQNNCDISELRKVLNCPFISYRQDSMDRIRSQRFLRQMGIPYFVKFQLENTEAITNAVGCGFGWTILPTFTLWNALEKPDTVTVHKINNGGLRKRLYLVTRDPIFLELLEVCKSVFCRKFENNYRVKIAKNCPALLEGLSLNLKEINLCHHLGI